MVRSKRSDGEGIMKRIFVFGILAFAACTKEEPAADTTRVASADVSVPQRGAAQAAPSATRVIKVYKDANCGC